jgi:hypothetical protein
MASEELYMLPAAVLALALAPAPPSDAALWDDFIARLRAGEITGEDLRPYYPNLLDPMLRYLGHFQRTARPDDWKAPELHRVGAQLHGIVQLTGDGGKKVPYCFTLLIEDSRWYFQHVESIFIRLDRTGPLPATRFPDVGESQKAWMRDERRATEQVRLFRFLLREKGRNAALQYFHDGAGYALEARTWVPFVSPARAFVLFLCWEQANLFASPVTLEALDDHAAAVRFQPRWFQLYKSTAHLSQMISEADFRALFEAVWQDRAKAAGWTLRLENQGDDWILRLKR